MSTQAQIQANRQNAQKSTGPRTPQGKATVAQNALKHGLCARHAVIVGEDPGQFETHRDQMLAELAPEGSIESTLAHRAVGLAWRLQRAERLQNEAFDTLHAESTTSPLARLHRSLLPKSLVRPEPEDPRDLTLGRVVVKDFAHTRVLDRLLMYERRLEHSLYKTIAELQRLRLLRQLNAPPEETTAPAAPNRAKQTQFAASRNRPNALSCTRLRPNQPSALGQEQTQSNPITPGVLIQPLALSVAPAESNGAAERISPSPRDRQNPLRIPPSRPARSQPAKAAVYSTPTHAGRESQRSPGAVTDLT